MIKGEPMANVLEISAFNWKDSQQGLALCKAIQANRFDVVISISNVGMDDSYRILLLSNQVVDEQDVGLACSPIPSTQDLDTLLDQATAGTIQGLIDSIAKTGLCIHTDYPNIPGFDACHVDENCVEGFDPQNPILPNIAETVQLMDNIQQIGGGSAGLSVIIGFPNHPFDPLP